MSADALKRLWPVFIVPKVRDWFEDHLVSGNVERVVIGVNSPLENLKASGPPVPDDGLTLDALATNCVIRPVAGLPALHDADLTVHIVGRDAQIALGKAAADLPSGRKLVLSSGLFEVPDTAPHAPPARVHFKIDGPVPAAVELLGHGPPARCCADTVRCGDDARHDECAGRFGHAAQARSAAGIDELRHHRRRHEFFRRTHDHGAEGRGGGSESQRQ